MLPQKACYPLLKLGKSSCSPDGVAEAAIRPAAVGSRRPTHDRMLRKLIMMLFWKSS